MLGRECVKPAADLNSEVEMIQNLRYVESSQVSSLGVFKSRTETFTVDTREPIEHFKHMKLSDQSVSRSIIRPRIQLAVGSISIPIREKQCSGDMRKYEGANKTLSLEISVDV